MKITDRTKQKMAKQRLKRVKEYYNCYCTGDSLRDKKGKKYIVISKQCLKDDYYFIVQNEMGEMFLQKLVYSGSVTSIGVSKTGRRYAENRQIFDSWFKDAETKLNRWIRSYYNATSVGKVVNEQYRIVLKREFNNKYYFVLKHIFGQYFVAKLVWFEEIKVVILSPSEFEARKDLFKLWIREVKT